MNSTDIWQRQVYGSSRRGTGLDGFFGEEFLKMEEVGSSILTVVYRSFINVGMNSSEIIGRATSPWRQVAAWDRWVF
jgi:hypothetical protein